MSDPDEELVKRKLVIAAAYAYEILGESFMSDTLYDKLSKEVDLSVSTRLPAMDEWLKANFLDYTGVWIHKFPWQTWAAMVAREMLKC